MRKCKSESDTLAFKYWNTAKWKAHFKSQVTKAQQYCNQYGEIPVIRAINKNQKLWSIRVAYFEKSIQKEARLYEKELENRVIQDIPKPSTDTKNMPSKPKGTNLFGEI